MALVQSELQKCYIRVDQQGWQPGPNTILYLPFNNNYNDESGNQRTGTVDLGTAPTYGTTTAGEKYVIPSSCRIKYPLSNINIGTWTVSQWIYLTNTNLVVCWYFGQYPVQTYGGMGMIINSSRQIVLFPYSGDINTSVQITRNVWHNIVFTQGGGTTTVYVDGASAYTRSGTYSGTISYTRLFANPDKTYVLDEYKGNYDEFIIENKTRTATEVSDYYNLTKGNYGL